jgi:hypothetical protein
MPSFTSTIRKELFSIKLLIGTCIIALLYLGLSVLLLNTQLFQSLLIQHVSFLEITSLFFSLFGGLWTSLSLADFLLTITSALFVGLNFMLVIRTLSVVEQKGKMHLSIGGATLISLVATGCASCGLSLLSVLGLSATLSFLPFHGLILHAGALIFLLLSTLYMLRQLHNGIYCKVER